MAAGGREILLTAIGGVLVVLNLMDARAAHREKYGEIKNQLPRGMRKFLHGRIKKALEKPGKGLIPSTIPSGLIVASSRFVLGAVVPCDADGGIGNGHRVL